MLTTLFACIGFMLAVLYIDLMFDVTAVPYRRSGTTLPKEVLDPIVHYYGRITQNPYVLMFVMLTTTVCLITQIVLRPGAAMGGVFLARHDGAGHGGGHREGHPHSAAAGVGQGSR